MAIRPPIVFAPLFLKDGDGTGSALVDNLGFDGGPLHQRLSYLYTLVAVDQPNMAEFDRPPHFAAKGLHLYQCPGFAPILLATCLNDCVHKPLSPLQKMIL